ncbi:MAG: penicillin-binding protein 1C [Flavobacteriales bacterium]|nr:penicillin-binding protein 1C [Flavobacteriales bacterium]
MPDQLFEEPTCTVLKDTNGSILGARIAKDGQRRFPPSDSVPTKFGKAIIEFEDGDFESHWGISFKAFGRAIKQNFTEGRVVSGGSTITMQTIRLSRKGKSRSYWEKLKEVYLATRLEWRFDKPEILKYYASNAPMGGNVVGVDAAAWRYYGRSSHELSWAEASLLAVLPNAPSLMHPGKNRDELRAKRDRLLARLHENGEFDDFDYDLALAEPLPDKPPHLPQLAPHLMNRLIAEGHKGELVVSTIDKNIQEHVINTMEIHHARLAENEIFNMAILVLDIENGTVVSYVGNAKNEDAQHGSAVDVIKAPRSTGSILKPYLYAGMLTEGSMTPNMLIEDVPIILSGYAPKNYNEKFDGAVPAQRALSRSLNVPIVKMLQDYSVPKFHNQLNKMGLTTINRPSSDYGLSLILGGAEAKLWDLCSVYGNMGIILKDFADGKEFKSKGFSYLKDHPVSGSFNYHLEPAAVWETFNAMLEVSRPDDEANWQSFEASQKIAWKTGTSFGFRDAWAIGVSSKYVVGIWVGNADGEGRPGLVGVKAAAPVLFDVFDRLPKSEWFFQPFDNMEEVAICRHSGHRASKICEAVDTIMIPKSCLKTTVCPYHKTVHLDQSGKHRVHSDCELVFNMKSEVRFVLPPIVESYYKNKHPNFKPLPPYRNDCESVEDQPIALIYPKRESTIYIPYTFDEEKSKTIFEATHRADDAILYWHLDEMYLGQTTDIHQQLCVPSVGDHVLTVIDNNGRSITRKFSVVGREFE